MGGSALAGGVGYVIKAPMWVKGAASSAAASTTSQLFNNGKIDWCLLGFDTATGAGLGAVGDLISLFAKTKPQSGRDFELYMNRNYGSGMLEQAVYKDGNLVGFNTPRGKCTIPDLFNPENLNCLEGKSYGLLTVDKRNKFIRDVCDQALKRKAHLPSRSSQILFVDLRGQNINRNILTNLANNIKKMSSGNIRQVIFVEDQFNFFAPYTSSQGGEK